MDLFTYKEPSPVVKDELPFSPRDYQQRAIDKSFELFAAGEPGVLIRSPTGTGKTATATFLAHRWLQQGENYGVLVLAHERQLIQQFAEEIREILGNRYTLAIEMGDQHCTGKEDIIVASRQTLLVREAKDEFGDTQEISRLYKFDANRNWLVISDEAHRWARKLKSCRSIIEHFEANPNSRRVGVTATPERTDKTSLSGLFPGIASDYRMYAPDEPCALSDGWVVPYDQRFITVEGVDFKGLREVAKDFDVGQLEEVLGEQETLAKLVNPTLDIVKDRPTIIFNPGVEMAKKVALYINAKLGRDAAYALDGSYPDDARQDVYRRFREGKFQILSICNLCREGFNAPNVGAVAIFRPTKSRSLAEQMKGRGCRPLKGLVNDKMTAEERLAAIANSAKPNCIIVDLVGVTGMADCAGTAHIFAQGLPDEVVERANENMLKKKPGESIDVAEEVRLAEEELLAEAEERERVEREKAEQRRREAEEREQARIEKEQRRQREMAEMQRRAKLKAEVRYQQQRVNNGQGAVMASTPQPKARMPFGKHKGELVALLSTGYLESFAKKVEKAPNWLKKAISNELTKRANEKRAAQKPVTPPKPAHHADIWDVLELLRS